MNEAQILAELIDKIDSTLKNMSTALSLISDLSKEDETKKALQKTNVFITKLNESMDAIQLITKYMRFDIEATRREREHLRGLLEDKDK